MGSGRASPAQPNVSPAQPSRPLGPHSIRKNNCFLYKEFGSGRASLAQPSPAARPLRPQPPFWGLI